MDKFIKNLLDNRFLQILFLPIGLYNLYTSYSLLRKEAKLLEDVINENDEFFTAIATMNFAPDNEIPFALSSSMNVDSVFTIDDIQDIVKETIIKTIMEFVKDESLLGIIIVKCLFINKSKGVKVIIQPANYQIFENDKKDVIQSLKIYLGIFLPIILLTYYFLFR